LAPSPSSVSQFKGYFREGEHKEDRNTVDDVEEDDLGDEELSAVGLLVETLLSICIQESVVRKDVSDEAVDSVDSRDLVNYDQEDATEASRTEEYDGSDPFDDMEDAHEEESFVINLSAFHSLRNLHSYFQFAFLFLLFEVFNKIFIVSRATDFQRLIGIRLDIDVVRIRGVARDSLNLVLKFRES